MELALENASPMPRLLSYRAAQSSCTDALLGWLVASSPSLTLLDLSYNPLLTDAGVLHLRAIPSLTSLTFDGLSALTPACLPVLDGLKLTHLSLEHTSIPRHKEENLRIRRREKDAAQAAVGARAALREAQQHGDGEAAVVRYSAEQMLACRNSPFAIAPARLSGVPAVCMKQTTC